MKKNKTHMRYYSASITLNTVEKTARLQDANYVAHPISFHATATWATLLLLCKERKCCPLGCEKEANKSIRKITVLNVYLPTDLWIDLCWSVVYLTTDSEFIADMELFGMRGLNITNMRTYAYLLRPIIYDLIVVPYGLYRGHIKQDFGLFYSWDHFLMQVL